nr:hypothetical protein MarFTME_330 [Marseillevirus futianmevirus]
MQSELLPNLETFLEEKMLLTKEEYGVSATWETGKFRENACVEVQVFLKKWRSRICSWTEHHLNNGQETLYYVERQFRSKERAAEVLELVCLECQALHSFHLEKLKDSLERNKSLEEDHKKLSKGIEELRRKNRELRYQPGGNGFLKAKQHFETNRS